MKVTLTVIKADIGSIGGHIKPGERLKARVRDFIEKNAAGLIHDYYLSSTGDDIAMLFSHSRGEGNSEIHKLAWDAFRDGTELAWEMGLYGAGQDLLKDSFSGNVKGMGPGVAEMEFNERKSEPI
ncbi:MAG: fructose 1,6-bisphosphatase, partial [Candidatus Krumholzibacteria bacterium]|nr:fructose 1,6-bisphosphatase [Candidatus Krumholzibacteria bacterium]